MKSIRTINNKAVKYMNKLTSFEKTKLIVEIDRILEAPYRSHSLDLVYYYVYYEPEKKCIYVLEKQYIGEIHKGDPTKEGYDNICHKVYIINKLLRGWK